MSKALSVRPLPATLTQGDPAARARPDFTGTIELTSLVVTPTDEEIETHGRPLRVCGECRYFNQSDRAQEVIYGQRFYERLVREEGWKLKHLCSPPQDLGLCDAWHGEMLTGRFHKACDQYRPANGLMRLTLRREKR
jgi:hypothetical protein